MLDVTELKQLVSRKFPEISFEESREILSIQPNQKSAYPLLKHLQTDSKLAFNYLTDLTGVDYLKQEREPRFDLVYHLFSFKNNMRVRVKIGIAEENMDVKSVSDIWKAAIWFEREAFEMYGFNFVNHPDLRRLLLPDVFDGYPLRKDYPLRGRGERDVILDLK